MTDIYNSDFKMTISLIYFLTYLFTQFKYKINTS